MEQNPQYLSKLCLFGSGNDISGFNPYWIDSPQLSISSLSVWEKETIQGCPLQERSNGSPVECAVTPGQLEGPHRVPNPNTEPILEMQLEEFIIPTPQEAAENEVHEAVESIDTRQNNSKREDNTTLRLVMTIIRNQLKIKGCKTHPSEGQMVQKLPGTKLGIEKLFSFYEMMMGTEGLRECLLPFEDELRKRGLVYRQKSPQRETAFYEHFDLVFQALDKGKDAQQRLKIMFNNRKHENQLRELESYRKSLGLKI